MPIRPEFHWILLEMVAKIKGRHPIWYFVLQIASLRTTALFIGAIASGYKRAVGGAITFLRELHTSSPGTAEL